MGWWCNGCLYFYFFFPVRLTECISLRSTSGVIITHSSIHSFVHQQASNSVHVKIRWRGVLCCTHKWENDRLQDCNVWIWEKREREKTRCIINYVINREHTWAKRVPWSKMNNTPCLAVDYLTSLSIYILLVDINHCQWPWRSI